MKFLRTYTVIFFALFSVGMEAAVVSGKVVDRASGDPLPGAVVTLDGSFLWSVTDGEGAFSFKDIENGSYTLEVSLLGYETYSSSITVKGNVKDLVIALSESTLALDSATVTAERSKDWINTTRTISRTALDHLQMSGLSDISALLPGGKTQNPDLTTTSSLNIRGGGNNSGNAAFSTAVEVNGVRIGDNADFGGLSGVDTRSLQVENIESVEVITGVPSAEYGDLGSGMVRVTTKKGRSPLSITLAVNPRTYDASFAKGVETGAGVLNISGQWTRATKKLSSPYTSYTRRGFTAEYSNTFAGLVRLEAGLSGNIGGMNSKDDPDTFSEQFTRERDNLLTPHVKAVVLLNRPWVTNISFEGSVYYHDRRTKEHLYNSYASPQPAVHAEEEGYFAATMLPETFYADRITDSRELDFSASLKYDWLHHFGPVKSVLKAGLQWKADGNSGRGEYYENEALAANGYRPRPYSDYPYMHTFSAYAEDKLTVPIGSTTFEASLGLRGEAVSVRGTQYEGLRALSPRLNARWSLTKSLSVRGGWGISRKLPSFYILYPKQEYRDIRTFAFSHGDDATYIYYTIPYTLEYNPSLQWQSNSNSEFGIDFEKGGWKASIAGFYNLTRNPYEYANLYTPISCQMLSLPEGFTMPASPEMRIDHQTGDVFIRGSKDEYFTPMTSSAIDRTFVNSRTQKGGADVTRKGLEFIVESPEIKPLHTRLRLDASYTRTSYINKDDTYYYQSGWSHTTIPNLSYQYAGIYEGAASVIQGRRTEWMDANLTAIVHIPAVRLIVTCRLEASLLRNSQNLSDRAFTVSSESVEPTGGDIYDSPSFSAVYPVAYLDLDGKVHQWTAECASDSDLQRLILRSGNMYTFVKDGYDPWASANLSLTKEIGRHVSLSFFANNFTAARPYRKSYANGISSIFTPAFYYGLTCRIKL